MNDDLVRESVGDGEKGKREREKSCKKRGITLKIGFHDGSFDQVKIL